MTVTTQHFREQLRLLAANGFSVITLSRYLDWRLGRATPPSANSVVLTFDDGHISFSVYARTILEEQHLPATLFIYPSCISRASYAMTWAQLREVAANPSFNIESHTFWHPNFKSEKKHLDRHSFQTFVDTQLQRSRAAPMRELDRPVDLLAWPYGIYDPFLMSRASAADYRAAFSIDCRAATLSDPLMAIPRCLVDDAYVGPGFLKSLKAVVAAAGKAK